MSPIFIRPQRPRRDFRLPILVFATVGVCALIFSLVSGAVMAHRYRDMMQYVHEMPCASPNDAESNRPPCAAPSQAMTVVSVSPYVQTHPLRRGGKSETRYVLRLRDAGGNIVTERGVDDKIGTAASVGKTVTAGFWRGKLTDIEIDGHMSETADAPFDAAERAVAPTFGGFLVMIFCGGVISILRKSR